MKYRLFTGLAAGLLGALVLAPTVAAGAITSCSDGYCYNGSPVGGGLSGGQCGGSQSCPGDRCATVDGILYKMRLLNDGKYYCEQNLNDGNKCNLESHASGDSLTDAGLTATNACFAKEKTTEITTYTLKDEYVQVSGTCYTDANCQTQQPACATNDVQSVSDAAGNCYKTQKCTCAGGTCSLGGGVLGRGENCRHGYTGVPVKNTVTAVTGCYARKYPGSGDGGYYNPGEVGGWGSGDLAGAAHCPKYDEKVAECGGDQNVEEYLVNYICQHSDSGMQCNNAGACVMAKCAEKRVVCPPLTAEMAAEGWVEIIAREEDKIIPSGLSPAEFSTWLKALLKKAAIISP
jgi:hypothetical protein